MSEAGDKITTTIGRRIGAVSLEDEFCLPEKHLMLPQTYVNIGMARKRAPLRPC
jgi:hypothetical protein